MPTKKFEPSTSINHRIGIICLSLAILSGCDLVPGADPAASPTVEPTSEIIPSAAPQILESYTVIGLGQDSFLSVYQSPTTDSQIVGQIPSFGTDILASGEIQSIGDTTWVQIYYKETTGWVNHGFLAKQYGTIPPDLVLKGNQIIESLQSAQYGLISPHIHPELCLRFSPYSYLNNDNQIICPAQLEELINSETVMPWGHYDGSGEPIELNFSDYHQRFVYDQDYFKAAVVGFNVEVSYGNIINNIQDIFPDGIMIEYHFPGIDPRYDGLDWRSLRLVFVELDAEWYLAAIIHGEWTI